MQKYYNPRLHNAVVAGTGMEHPRRPHVVLGSELNGYVQGDLVDANGICDLIHEKNVDTFAKLEALETSLKNESKARVEGMDNLSEQIDRTIAEKLGSTETVYGESVQRAAEDERLQSQINELNDKYDAIQEYQDISGKADKTTVDAALATKADKSATYTKGEVDDLIDGVDVSEQLENYYTEDETDAALAGKQDTINDLSTIRSGAAAGATAVQPAALTPIENDIDAIEGKIPSAASASNQLADKAFVNSALAAKQDTLTFDNTPTANSNNPVKSGGVYQAIQDIDVSSQISGKEDKSNKVTSFSSPTDTEYPSAKLVNDQLATKQDVISDLSAIISGAAAGATAVQSVTIGTTTTGAAGTDASVINTGTTTEPVLSFIIPEGAKGDKGDTGETGPQGPQGLQGNSGYTGAAGELEVVNNLTGGGTTKALSAEMGKQLSENLTTVENIVEYINNDAPLIVLNSDYKKGDRVKDSEGVMLRITKDISVLNNKETIAIGDLKVSGTTGTTYKAKAAISDYNSSTTYSNGDYSLGHPTRLSLQVVVESLAAGDITVTFGSNSVVVALDGTEADATEVAAKIQAALTGLSITGWTFTVDTDTVIATCDSVGNNSSVVFTVANTDTEVVTGVSGTRTVVWTGGDTIAQYDGSTWTSKTASDLKADTNLFDTITTLEGTGGLIEEATEVNSSTKDFNDLSEKVGDGVSSEETRDVLMARKGAYINTDGKSLTTNTSGWNILLFNISKYNRITCTLSHATYSRFYLLNSSYTKVYSKTGSGSVDVNLNNYPTAKYVSVSDYGVNARRVYLYRNSSDISSKLIHVDEVASAMESEFYLDSLTPLEYDTSKIQNAYINNGTVTSNGGSRLTPMIDVSQYDAIYVAGKNVNNGDAYAGVVGYDEDSNYLGVLKTGTATWYTDAKVSLPLNIKYVRVHSTSTPIVKINSNSSKFAGYDTDISAIRDDINTLTTYTFYPKDIPFTIETEGYRFLNTNLSASANYCITNYIEVIPGKKLHICTGFSTSQSYRTGVWYNADKAAITYIDGSTVAWNTREIVVPSNAKYLRLCTNNRYGLRLYYISEPTIAEEIVEEKYKKIPLTINNGYYTSSGGVSSGTDSRYKRTEFNIVQGEKFKIKTYNYAWSSAFKNLVLYNEDEETYIPCGDSYPSVEYFTAPFNGKVMLSGSNGNNTPRTSFEVWKYGSSSSSGNKAFNKTIHTVGHSFWNGDGLSYTQFGQTKTRKGYQSYFKDIYEFNSFNDLKYDGHSLGAQSASDTSSIALKLSSWTGTAGDIWCMDSITNDFKRNIPLGTLADNYNAAEPDALTYYGALRLFRNKVVEVSGSEAIVVVSNATHRNQGGYTSTSTNTAGCTLSDYSHALMCVAEIEGWYFVDVFNYGGITDDNLSYTTIDGLHPNNLGYRLSVKPWIEQLNIIKEMYG